MNKVLIDLSVPSIGEHYNLFIPDFLTIREICSLLSDALVQMTEGVYVRSGKEVLCVLKTKEIMYPEGYLYQYQIKNGDRLVLI